jgi:hypothetical protein
VVLPLIGEVNALSELLAGLAGVKVEVHHRSGDDHKTEDSKERSHISSLFAKQYGFVVKFIQKFAFRWHSVWVNHANGSVHPSHSVETEPLKVVFYTGLLPLTVGRVFKVLRLGKVPKSVKHRTNDVFLVSVYRRKHPTVVRT